MPPPAADAAPRADVDARTVFVRGLAYDASKDDLEAAFAAVGPVRSAFVVGDGAGGKHKGVGFVQFALPEDAGRAVADLDGSQLKGRKIKVELAHKRASFEERKKRKRGGGDGDDGAPAAPPPATPRAAAPKPADPAKHVLVRTVALGNLTPDIVAAALAAAKAAGTVVNVTHPAPDAAVEAAKLRRDGCSGGVAFVEYDSVKGALAAVAALHGAAVTAAPAKGARKAAALAPSTILWARQVSGEGALLKRWRVIVRNVAYSVSEADLRAALAPAGFVWELSVPRRPDGSPRGFAFAGFTTRAAAEKAIAAVNGLELGGRVVAVDWAVGKGTFDAAKAKDGADAAAPAPAPPPADGAAEAAGAAASGDGDASDDGDDGDAEVDVGKERALLASVVAGLGDDDGHAGAGKPAAKQPPAKRGRDDDPAARAAAAAAKIAAATKAAADRLAAAGAAVDGTVFVRGIPPDATAGDVRARLEGFGDVRACRLVLDKATGRPKGTAFVEFADGAAAARAAAASDAADAKDGRPLTVCGADVRVALALSRDGARALAAERGGGGAGAGDGRNLHLAREGRIEPGSAAWAALPPGDRALRQRLVADANAKLRSPNFCVSRTRLCVRNLPFSVDEAALKKLLVDAVKARATRETPKIVHVKILRGARKPGAAPTSKGAGFVEFGAHEHAVAALRALNNSPTAFGPDRRPVVEFAIDDVRALKKRADARERAKSRAAADKEAAGKEGAAAGGKGGAAPAKRERGAKNRADGDAAPATRGKRKPAAVSAAAEGDAARRAGGKRKAPAAAADEKPAKRKPDPKPKKAQPEPKAKRALAAAPATPARQPRKKNAAARAAARGADTRDATDDLISRYQSKLFGSGGAGLSKWI